MNKNKNKKALAIIISICLIAAMSVTSFAAWDSFEVTLLKNSLNTEVSTSAKSGNGTEYFTIDIDKISGEYTSVRVWTEHWITGANYSSSLTQIGVGKGQKIDYSTVPSNGAQVVLNMDNPVRTENRPTVSGQWNPN